MEITEQDALERFRARLRYGVRQGDLAREFGVSDSFISAVLRGQRKMTEPMLRSVGVERLTSYRDVSLSRRNAKTQAVENNNAY